jgi:hypothetical protein
MPDTPAREGELIHQFKNHLSVIVGFCELLLSGCEETSQRHQDLLEIQKAANAALALVPQLSERVR